MRFSTILPLVRSLSKTRAAFWLLALAGFSFALTGVALNGKNAPLSGVEVQLVLDGSSTTTADDGSFTLTPKTTGTVAASSAAFDMHVAEGSLLFTLPASSTGSIRTFDILGHRVNASSSFWAAGDHAYAPFGNNANPASGLYLVQYQFGSRKGGVTLAVSASQRITVATSRTSSQRSSVLRLEATSTIDTVRFSLTGYMKKSVPITDYSADLGSVVMSEGCDNTYGKNIMTDCRDGQTYATMDIGYRTWMVQNLNYKPSTGSSWCYNNDEGYCSLYGRLYNWVTAMDTSTAYANVVLSASAPHRGLCPYGWHVPTATEWQNNPYEVTGMASGYWYGTFREADTSGHWWASSEGSGTTAYAALDSSANLTAQNKAYGYSLRCVTDASLPTQIQDTRDGSTYSTVAIGQQVWLTENMHYAGFSSDSVDTSSTEAKSYTRISSYTSDELYNYVAAQNVCPSGTHLPDTTEWRTLVNFAGVRALESQRYWSAIAGCYSNCDGTDQYGFDLRPIIDEPDEGTGSSTYLWTSNYDTTGMVGSYFYFDNRFSVEKGSSSWKTTHAVRCIVNRGSSSSSAFPYGTTSSSSFSWTDCVNKGQCGTFSDDRDTPASTYKWVKIGSQTWMAQNLAYLPDVSNVNDMSDTEAKYYIYGYQDNSTSGPSVSAAKSMVDPDYGVLYNWTAAMAGSASSTASPSGVQGICPDDWHLPSKAEWDTLIAFVGGRDIAGRKLKATKHWQWSSTNRDAYGFSAEPGGQNYGVFGFIGTEGLWWTTTLPSSSTGRATAKVLYYDETKASEGDVILDNGISVRCVKNE